MTMPRRRVTRGRPRPASAHARIPLSAEPEAERAVLRALHRIGVDGGTGLSCLIAAGELLAAVRASSTSSHVDLHVVSSAATVHLEFDVTGLDGLEETASQSDSFPATRWGTVREHGRAVLWADVDRTLGDADHGSRVPIGLSGLSDDGEPRDPIRVLLDVTTRLARARSLADIAAVVDGPLRAHLRANAATLAVRNAATVRLVSHELSDVLHRRSGVGHPDRFPIGSDLPIAASIRDGSFCAYASSRLLEQDFPGVAAQVRADDNDALVTVPVTVTGHPIGALAIGWRGTRPVEKLRPLLVIVAKHSADAAIRVWSPHPGVTAMRPAGPRVPGTRGRVATSIGGLRLDVVARQVFVPGRTDPVRLTGREFELLLFLSEHIGTAQTRLQTLREVWGIDFRADTSVVDVTVSRLRRKLGPDVIVTIRDQGYMLRA